MVSQTIIYAGVLLLGAAISSWLAVLGGSRRGSPGNLVFHFLMWSIAAWLFTCAMEMLSPDPSAKVLWSKFQYGGMVNVAPLWLIFTHGYSRRSGRWNRHRLILLWIVPAATLALALTNEWHRLIWLRTTPVSQEPGALIIYEHGPAFWVFAAYSYCLLLLASFWLVQSAVRSPRLDRRRAWTMLFAAFFPWAGNLLNLAGLSLRPGLDLTPFGFTLTGLLLAWGFLRFGLLEVIPAAKETLFASLTDGALALDLRGRVLDINPAAQRILGTSSDAVGQKIARLLQPWPTVLAEMGSFPEKKAEIAAKDPGSGRWLEWVVSPTCDRGGKPSGRLVIIRDITDRKKAEVELRKNEELYRKLISTLPDIIAITDLEGNIQFINDFGVRLSRYDSASELEGQSMFSFIAPEDMERAVQNSRLMSEKTLPPAEYAFLDKNGNRFPFEVNGEILRNPDGTAYGFVFSCRDLSERKQAESALRATLREKEVLLKELHHRVKNNLQVISSLLNHQARTIKDPEVQAMFQESQNRIRSIALVHEKLYKSQDLAGIDFSEYIRGLVVQLFHSAQPQARPVEFKPDLNEISLNITTAIPLGLIINELVMNVLKHAFPDGRRGELLIRLAQSEDQKLILVIKDTGVGFPKDLDFRKTQTLGMQIVNMLVDQIGGSISMERDGGTEFRIVFSELREKSQA